MQCACAILSSVTFPAVRYFSTLSHNKHDFGKRKVTEQKNIYILISLLFLSEICCLLRRTERDMIENVHSSLCKIPVCSCPILIEFENPQQIF
jgi:hypothetical protein